MSKKKTRKKQKKGFKKESMTEQEMAEQTEEFLIKSGDFILVELAGRVKSSGKLIDVTDEEVARAEGVYDEKEVYKPRLVIVGKGWVIKGVDDHLGELVVGVPKAIEIPPKDAFGEKEAKNIKTYSIREVQKNLQKGQKPRPGATITLEGRRGFIRQITQGRVRVDFNHPLAGETITYDVKVVKKIIDVNEKVMGLINRRIPKIGSDQFKLIQEGTLLQIHLPKEVFFDQNLPIAKIGIASEIQEYVEGIDTIQFIETYGEDLFKPQTGSHEHAHNHKHNHNH
ncbi:MAG: FKBP-type peptidyl-prolyl cis-trans isomerase [Candidatus Helarchaeota archaeon]